MVYRFRFFSLRLFFSLIVRKHVLFTFCIGGRCAEIIHALEEGEITDFASTKTKKELVNSLKSILDNASTILSILYSWYIIILCAWQDFLLVFRRYW